MSFLHKSNFKKFICANQLSINVWQLLHKCMATTLCICCVCHCIFKKPFLCEQSNHGLPLTGSYAPPFDAYQYETGTNHQHASGFSVSRLLQQIVICLCSFIVIHAYIHGTYMYLVFFLWGSFSLKLDGYMMKCMKIAA